MTILSIRKYKDLAGKKIFLRADFNVPIKNGVVRDDFKITAGLATIRYLQRYNAKIIITSHLGKPGGEYNEKYSLAPVVTRLSRLLGKRINFVPGVFGMEAGTAVSKMRNGDIVFIDNLRFNKGEEKNSKKFAKDLSKLADIYVNNAFAVSHRAHASVSAIKNYLPSFAGLLLEKEIENLNKVIIPKKPLIVVMGGSKIGSKTTLVKKLYPKAHKILIGGALANNFLLVRGFDVGRSLVDRDSLKFAKGYKSGKVLLPVDVLVKNLVTEKISVKKISEIGEEDSALDIGPETIKLFSSYIKRSATIIWNGPLGMFESPRFRVGTMAIGQIIASRSGGRTFGVVGGGETVEALKKTKMQDHVDWVSTGGGAMLSYLGGETMPGLLGIVKK
ncbi:MAG: phosphoglycerate kinase [Patescibacteria group bacterium]|jgi:phosphoglycerate kinase|nr:phosphoglycerate kinase [Patescibacteria group bacterium]